MSPFSFAPFVFSGCDEIICMFTIFFLFQYNYFLLLQTVRNPRSCSLLILCCFVYIKVSTNIDFRRDISLQGLICCIYHHTICPHTSLKLCGF